MKKAKEKEIRKKASISKMGLAQTFSLKEKLYQKNYFLSTGSFFRKKVFCEKKKCWYKNVLSLAFVLFVIFAFASSICPTTSAWTTECGCFPGTCKPGDGGCSGCVYNNTTPSVVKYHDTIHGGVYFETSFGDAGYGKAQTMTANFTDVPEGIKMARVYTGFWGASPGHGCKFRITINDNPSTDYCACDPRVDEYEWMSVCDAVNTSECHADITGCGVNFISYNATGNITAGNNTITMQTWGADDCCGNAAACVDGRIYSIALLVVYEDPNMPEILYWVNEETHFVRNIPPVPPCNSNYPCDRINIYFNGTAYPGSMSDLKYWSVASGPNVAFRVDIYPELNGENIGKPDYSTSQMYRWDNIPLDHLTPSDNHFYYYLPAEQGDVWDRLNVAVLMLNSSGPANLTMTDISPSGLYADPDETGRYANIINATVVNYGKAAYFFNVTLYANDTVVDVKRVTNLGEGESRVVSLLWAPNQTGSYELNVTADVENVVRETDETNNSKTLSVEVTEAPPPAWQSQSSSVPEIPEGGTIELRAQGRADIGLDEAILATNETGTWINHTDYCSPLDMASYFNYSITHTSESDWNNQTIDTFMEEGVTNPNLKVSGGDIKLNQITGTDNLALNKPAYAKDYFYPPSDAVDGNLATSWESYTEVPPTNWWYVDLEEVTSIKKVWFRLEQVYGKYHYAIYISNDNETWTKKIEMGAANGDQSYSNLDWSCRYINITFFSVSGTGYAGIYEFKAYGLGDYRSSGNLTSKTVETNSPIVSVIPTWNSTEPAGTSLSVNVSVDGGATWKPSVNGEMLTWDYNVLNNTKLKYKVLFGTTDGSQTPVLHDITLNYTTRDPIEGEWVWSNFTWQNASIPGGTTVGWRIYYEDMLGQTNCTDVKTFVVGALGYKICGYADPAADNVNFTNLNKSEVIKDRPADYIDPVTGFYNLTLNVPTEVEAGNVLQIVACEEIATHEHNCNVSNHVVVNAPGEDTNVNLTLNHYCLNYYPDYPYKTWEQTNWSGPAVMQMLIYHYRPQEPGQSDLNATGIAHNQNPCNSDLLQVDPAGMRWTLNDILHNTSSYGGGPFANYGIGSYTTVENALWYICYWQYAGPGAAPTYGNYSNWMSIRGIHTSENPKWQSQGSYDIYGFWINDPNPTGGIGENTYKSVDQWTGTYFKNLTGVRDCDSYKNRYVAVCEPPEQDPAEVRLVHSKARFSGTITAEVTDEELTVDIGGVPLNQLICNRKLAREKEIKVVQAAIDGVNEQLAFDYDFKKTFDGTVAGKPMPVKSDAGDYYLVPFGIESDSKSVLVVVIVDSDGGKFKEASWIKEPVKYLSVTPQEALKIVYKEMKGKSTVKVLKKDKATGKLKKADVIDEVVDTLEDIRYDETEKQRRKAYLELVYKDKSPYYPVWKITIGDSVFFVDQSGTLTTTPTPTPKSIEPVLQIVE